MRRKRTTPWIHRWSRPLSAGIATIGAAVTGYLTFLKLAGGSAACPTHGCDIVLSSPYATVFGLPLALFGFLAYASMIVFAIAPLLVPAQHQELRSKLDQWTRLLLFLGGTAMLVFSGYLMYLLAFHLKAVCVYCIGSALLSASLFTLAIIGQDWQDVGQLFFSGSLVAVLVLVSTLGVYSHVTPPAVAGQDTQAEQTGTGETGLPITTTSGEAELALAAHLKEVGAKMYGAWWCPHCHDQKLLFGQQAFAEINYIECDPRGRNPQTALCQSEGIRGFPTWKINGQVLTGTQPLTALADASGYQGPRNFRNLIP